MLSYSKVKKFLQCSQMVWWEDQGWRLQKTPDEMVFGAAFHKGISNFFITGEPPLVGAQEELKKVFGNSGWFDSYNEKMKVLLDIWERDPIVSKLHPILVEEKVTLAEMGFTGVVDFYGKLDEYLVCIDWKTSGSRYEKSFYENMDAQLTAYKILLGYVLKRPTDRLGFCVINKKDLSIQWLWFDRTLEQVGDYLSTIKWVDSQIKAGEHHKLNDSFVCGKCPYLPLCLDREPRGLVNVRGGEF